MPIEFIPMKTSLTCLLALSAVVLPCLAAEASPPTPAPAERGKRVFHEKAIAREPVTFLGVESTPASPALAAQLGLPKGFGLVVTTVLPDSPAASALQAHDVLTKLNDQLLVDTRQLGALVRSFKEGDEVVLTYVRAGKTASAKVKLAKREMAIEPFGIAPLPEKWQHPAPFAPGSHERADRLLSLIEGEGPGFPLHDRVRIVRRMEGGMPATTAIDFRDSHMVFRDDQGTIEITVDDGKKTVLAKDQKGNTQFSGPFNTPEEEKAVPEEVRKRIPKLDLMKEFRFKTDRDFDGETRLFETRPAPIGGTEDILIPAPARQAI